MRVCQKCGKEYIVKSARQKYCSPACSRVALLEWQRMHKHEVRKESDKSARKEYRKKRQKVCVYCQRVFWSETSTNVCSDFCRKNHRQIQQAKTDIKRGKKANLQKMLNDREEYRKSF